MAIIAILLGLLTPAISAMTSTAGRKGAVNILMNTFEQARVRGARERRERPCRALATRMARAGLPDGGARARKLEPQ
jgi:hypothetical protein